MTYLSYNWSLYLMTLLTLCPPPPLATTSLLLCPCAWLYSWNLLKLYKLCLNKNEFKNKVRIVVNCDCSHEIRRWLLLGRKMMKNLDSVLKSRGIYTSDKGPYSQGHGLLRGHIWLCVLNHKKGRAPKNWCLQTVVLEKTPEIPVDSKEIKPVNLKGNQPWIPVGRTDAEAEAPVFWSSEANCWPIGKVPDAG